MFDINNELKKLPEKPGVYLMKDSSGKIIYVGKALILKNRVKSYFLSTASHTPKTRALVKLINSFEIIVTSTELEALILECSLIKQYRPQFNILLKDDKNYPYIKITYYENFPRVKMVRKVQKDGAKYFGPYSSAFAVRDTIRLIEHIFPLKTCNRNLPRDIGKERPCLNYHIGKCLAPCMEGSIGEKEYREMIDDVCAVINGKYEKVLKKLNEDMKKASTSLNFELAAQLRDKIKSLYSTTEKQKVIFQSKENMDIISFAKDEVDVCVQVFVIRDGRISGRESFILEGKGCDGASDAEIMQGFMQNYYESNDALPKEILLQHSSENNELLQEWLSSKSKNKVYLKVPSRGKNLDLVNMVAQNARLGLLQFNEAKTKEREQCRESMLQLQIAAKLQTIPMRVEAFDISNNGNTEIVGTKTLFVEGKPVKKGYRRYKMKTIEQQDDYAAMQEMLERRIKKFDDNAESISSGDSKSLDYIKPNIFLIDGGIGHINAVKKVLDANNICIPVAGMVKDDRHRSRGLILLSGEEVEFKDNINLMRFISLIQDETHKYAIDYNKKLVKKRYYTSILDNINGVGKKRKIALLTHFGSINKVKVATKEQLMEVPGINREVADTIIAFFNKYER